MCGSKPTRTAVTTALKPLKTESATSRAATLTVIPTTEIKLITLMKRTLSLDERYLRAMNRSMVAMNHPNRSATTGSSRAAAADGSRVVTNDITRATPETSRKLAGCRKTGTQLM